MAGFSSDWDCAWSGWSGVVAGGDCEAELDAALELDLAAGKELDLELAALALDILR